MSTSSGTSHDRNPVEALADDFLRRQRGGERPTLEEYCRRHPGQKGHALHRQKGHALHGQGRKGRKDTHCTDASYRQNGKKDECRKVFPLIAGGSIDG
jgi:hypothetical protein